MRSLHADVVIIGSGMGGGTTARALARRGVNVLVLERGERLPREPENWSPRAVFVERRYKPDELWRDGEGRSFAPGVHYVAGGNTKVYGASLNRFRERDFGAVEHEDGISPAWPFSYSELEPYYGEAERMYGVYSTTRCGNSAPAPDPSCLPQFAVSQDNILGTGLGDMFQATRGCSESLKHEVEMNRSRIDPGENEARSATPPTRRLALQPPW